MRVHQCFNAWEPLTKDFISVASCDFMIDNQIYGYADSLLVGLEYMVTSLYSDSRLKGANLYQGDSSSLTFELLDQDDNIVELCSRGTTEYVLPKDVCASNASSVEFASASLPCRF